MLARHSMPRFDLYAALGVEPSADVATIRAAYQHLLAWRSPDPTLAETRRLERAARAHEWLTNAELRSQYDATRAQAAARSAEKAAIEVAETAPVLEREPEGATFQAAVVEPMPAEDISWPNADEGHELLERPEFARGELQRRDLDRVAGVEWSTTPITPSRSRPSRRSLGVLAGAALLGALAAGVFVVFSNVPRQGVGVSQTASPPPVPTDTAPPPSPTPAPSIVPTLPPTHAGIDTIVLQRSAWETIQALSAAAEAGDVATAQTYLGKTAPGLRKSGLRRATFPDLEAAAIKISGSAGAYVALAGEDRLTSRNGTRWAFDYAERPLAAYVPPNAEFRDLWWGEADGQHHLLIRIASATLSQETVVAKLAWLYDPSRPDDATYFERAEVLLTSLSLDWAAPTPVAAERVPMAGTTTVTTSGTYTTPGFLPENLTIAVTITNPRTVGGEDRAVDTTFVLAIR